MRLPYVFRADHNVEIFLGQATTFGTWSQEGAQVVVHDPMQAPYPIHFTAHGLTMDGRTDASVTCRAELGY